MTCFVFLLERAEALSVAVVDLVGKERRVISLVSNINFFLCIYFFYFGGIGLVHREKEGDRESEISQKSEEPC